MLSQIPEFSSLYVDHDPWPLTVDVERQKFWLPTQRTIEEESRRKTHRAWARGAWNLIS